jgi:hypothetical protein
MIEFAPGVLEAMLESAGFEKSPEGAEIKATFNLVRAYHVEGLILEESEFDAIENMCHKDKDFAFGFGNDLNKLSQYLFNEDLVDDDWLKENDATSPFLIIHISLNKFFACKSAYWKKEIIKDEEIISTYDSFPEAREILKKKESDIIPLIMASLWVSFSCLHEPIRFQTILRETYGKTDLRKTIYDIRSEISGTLSILKSINPLVMKTLIQDSLSLYSHLDHEISLFVYTALEEEDRLKRFLNLFLVLEIYTHRVFKKIDPSNQIIKADNIPIRIEVSGKKFFLEQQSGGKTTLLHRFYLCAFSVWKEINDQDIENFQSIVHGEIISEDELPIKLAEKLCSKILSLPLIK